MVSCNAFTRPSRNPANSFGFSFAAENRVNYGEPAEACNVAENVVKLNVHLIQRLLHVQNVLGCHLDKLSRCLVNERSAQTGLVKYFV